MPAVIATQPAHLGGTVVEAHLGHHFIGQQFQSDHRIIIHETFRLLTGAFIERAEQKGRSEMRLVMRGVETRAGQRRANRSGSMDSGL
jgi:hypothetical protein